MRSRFRRWWLLLITVVGCSASVPPFDELPLRDTLRADPEIVAGLDDDARARLAARFQAAGAGDTAVDPAGPASSVAALIAQVDLARQRRAADALVIGTVGGGSVQALPSGTQARGDTSLPPLEGPAATATAALESRALGGPAGASLRELLAASHASRLERVVGWPVAAVVAGGTAYVNGAWLVAMAPADGDAGRADAGGADAGACDAGACDAGAPPGGGSAMVPGRVTGWGGAGGSAGSRGGLGGTPWTPGTIDIPPSTYGYDAGAWTTSDPNRGVNDGVAAADGCAAAADGCDATDDGSGDSCDSSTDDGSGDSCNSSADDGSGDSCNSTADDGSTSDCQTAPGRRRPTRATVLWLMAPVAYLWGRKR